MDTAGFLARERETIVGEAESTLVGMHERHYEAEGSSTLRDRLDRLYDVLVDAVETRDLTPVVAYASLIARERFEAGYDLAAVQVAFNTLEASTWSRILARLEADELAEALGLVSTVFGAAKDALGREYVSCASRTRAPSLDLRSLFAGTDGV